MGSGTDGAKFGPLKQDDLQLTIKSVNPPLELKLITANPVWDKNNQLVGAVCEVRATDDSREPFVLEAGLENAKKIFEAIGVTPKPPKCGCFGA